MENGFARVEMAKGFTQAEPYAGMKAGESVAILST